MYDAKNYNSNQILNTVFYEQIIFYNTINKT